MARKKLKRNTHKSSLPGITRETRKTIKIDYPIGKTVFPEKKRPIRVPTHKLLTTRKRVASSDLSKRTVTNQVAKAERAVIRKRRVAPLLSKLSPLSCRKKRAEARRSYLSMKFSGKGTGSRSIINPQRFTVRCN